MPDGRLQQQVVLPVASGAYIAPGAVFNITVTDATLQGTEGVCVCYMDYVECVLDVVSLFSTRRLWTRSHWSHTVCGD